MAQGAQVERAGALAIIVDFLAALGAFYCAAAGLWGAWRPATTRASVRAVRILLSWVVLMSVLLCLGLRLTAPATMTRSDWASFVAVAAYLVIALAAIVGVVRKPRLTVTVLGLAAAYAGLSLAYELRNIIVPGRDQLSGPAPAISFVIAGSLLVAVIAAFVFAWPLRSNGGEASF
ncbi:MAG TPA: hypothetical protein VN650_06230 [Gemmatimonadaceae bacterium]|nr:hypothetical protein [Gemmatimonadaceae bacterium]